jgi:hypothetical protein
MPGWLDDLFSGVPFVNWWGYMPGQVRSYFILFGGLAAALLIGAYVGFGFYFRYVHSGRHEVERQLRLEERVRDARRHNYQEEWRNTDSVMLTQTGRWDDVSSIYSVSKIMVFSDHEVRFDVTIPFQDAFWRRRSRVRFEHQNGVAVSLRNLFRESVYQSRFSSAEHLVCVGLASRTAETMTPDLTLKNENLSRDRALNLCRMLAGSIGRDRPKSYWMLPLGYSNARATEDNLEEGLQRTVAIISISGARNDAEMESVLSMAVMRTQLNNVNLGNYSLSANPSLEAFQPNWDSTSPMTEDDAYSDAE